MRQNKSLPPDSLIKLVAFNAKYVHSCLALFYLRNELNLHLPEHETQILQLTINDNEYESVLRVTEGEPAIVFISAAIWNSERVCRLVRDLHRCLPTSQIIIGGPQAGVVRKELPEDLCSVVLGEIEAVDEGFYDDLVSGKLKPYYTGSFLKKRPGPLKMPYREEDFADQLKNRHIYYESSRGCPYACTYCLSASERGIYHKNLDQVKEELTFILHHKPKVIRFVDRTFNDNPERALQIWRFIHEQQTNTLFHFEIAPERFTEEMFILLEKVEHGRFQFEIGIQSTHLPTLEAIRRKIDTQGIKPVVQRLTQLQTIHLHVDLILGLPRETSETFAQSFRDVFSMGAHYIQMGLLKILPDTPICHQVDEHGYKYSPAPPYSVFANKWLSHSQLSELYWFSECVEKMYNNRYFVSLWSYFREREEDIFLFFQEVMVQGKPVDLLHRSTNQELLCEILVDVCQGRQDFQLIIELLRYDWLRCGYRKLPSSLAHEDGEESCLATRDILYRELADHVSPFFTPATRNMYFKKSAFLRISRLAGDIVGYRTELGSVRLAFVQQRDMTPYRHNEVHLLQQVA